MGIYCNIIIDPPVGGPYFVAGNSVSGAINYNLDSEYTFKRILVSLKGIGRLTVRETTKTSNNDRRVRVYNNAEDYVNIQSIVQEDKEEKSMPSGQYHYRFRFQLPWHLPSSLSYRNIQGHLDVACIITYYVRIKFEAPGMFQFDKKFKKEIIVKNFLVTRRVPMCPFTYTESKKLFQPFRRKDSFVNVKAHITKSLIQPGEKILMNIEVENDTNIIINSVKTRVIGIYSFYVAYISRVEMGDKIKETVSRSTAITKGETRLLNLEINLPNEVATAEFSRLVSREYFVIVKIELPTPHLDFFLRIPIQVGYNSEPYFQQSMPLVQQYLPPVAYPQTGPSQMPEEFSPEGHLEYAGVPNDSPPTYWEAMNEYSGEDKFKT